MGVQEFLPDRPSRRRRGDVNAGWPPDVDGDLSAKLDELITPPAGGDRRPRPYISPSNAGKCARALSYDALGFAQGPVDLASQLTFDLGDALHDRLQTALRDGCDEDGRIEIGGVLAELGIEVPIGVPGDGQRGEDGETPPTPMRVTVRGTDIDVFGYVDLTHHETATDIKSKGGYGYKMAVGERKPAEGPDVWAVVQALIGALCLGLRFGKVLVVAKDGISKTSAAARKLADPRLRVVAEWTVELDGQWLDMVELEMLRMWKINQRARTEGILAKRVIPGVSTAEIADPGDGTVNGTGKVVADDGTVQSVFDTFHCAYCGHRERCITDGPGLVTLAKAAD